MFQNFTEDTNTINSQPNKSSTITNTTSSCYIPKQQLISYLNKKIEDNPIDNYNEYTREHSRGYFKALDDILKILIKY